MIAFVVAGPDGTTTAAARRAPARQTARLSSVKALDQIVPVDWTSGQATRRIAFDAPGAYDSGAQLLPPGANAKSGWMPIERHNVKQVHGGPSGRMAIEAIAPGDRGCRHDGRVQDSRWRAALVAAVHIRLGPRRHAHEWHHRSYRRDTIARPRALSPQPQLIEVPVHRLGLNGRLAAVLAAVALMLSACTSAATAPAWTYPPVSSASAAAAPTAAPSVAPTAQPTAAPTPGPSAGPTAAPTPAVAIYTSEWSVGLPTSMLTGEANFSITNIGAIEHELLIFKSDLAASAYPVDKDGNIIEDGPGITLVSDGDNINPGNTQTRAVDLTQPGAYLFVCNIPGHFKAGMFRVVTVTPPSAEQFYIPAALAEWHVAVPPVIKAGTVNLETANFGTIQHELLVFKSDLAASAYPVDKDGNIIEDGPGITLVSDGDNIEPGKTQTRTVDLTQPGTYLFVCNIEGHFKAGMFSVVTVTP